MKSALEILKEKWIIKLAANPKYKTLSDSQLRHLVDTLFSFADILYIVMCQEDNNQAHNLQSTDNKHIRVCNFK
jgi:hypothetical protein